LFGEISKNLVRLNAVCHYPLTLVVRNNAIRMVLSPLPTDAIITIETSSALDEISKEIFGYARPVVVSAISDEDSSEVIENLTPGSRSESPETTPLLAGGTADDDGLEPVADAASAAAGPSSAQLGEEEDSTELEAEEPVDASAVVDTVSLHPTVVASETGADATTDPVPVTAGDPGSDAVSGQGSSTLCGSFSPVEAEAAMTLSCLAAGSPRDYVPATAAIGGDLPEVSPTGLLDVPSPTSSVMAEFQPNHDMAKAVKDMFSLSPFEYSPSNFLNMSPGEGSSKVAIEIITDNDDEPEITFSTIPE
jgi:hypothetical protein